MLHEVCFALFGLLSFLTALGFALYTALVYRKKPGSKRTVSSLIFYTSGVFLAVLLMFLPIYYCYYDFGDRFTFGRPFWLSLHNAMRVFILDGEFDIVRDAVAGLPAAIRIPFAVNGAVLFVLAPVMTFGNVLSLFKNFGASLRYRFLCNNRPLYIMSELNNKSIVLAESILNRPCTGKKPVIVFTDVYVERNEDTQEPYSKARELHAVCLKEDVRSLNLQAKKGNVELFLIGDDEAENMAQASELVRSLDKEAKKQNVKVFVFARMEARACTLESQRYDNLLKMAGEKDFGPDTFKLRRVNVVHQLVQKTVPRMQLAQHSREHVISVMLVGMGEYGMEFLKMLLWYCQLPGYRLELNLFDKTAAGSDGNSLLEGTLRRKFPELMKRNPCSVDGDANYDIKCYENVVFGTDDFARLLEEGSPDRERLQRTTHVVVALGDDDLNVETSIYLRMAFDRCNRINSKKVIPDREEQPQIYTIVYDEQKFGLVAGEETDSDFLRNHTVPYHIHCIGSTRQQYAYESVYDQELEQAAYAHHISWADINKAAAEELRQQHYTEEQIVDAGFGYYQIDPTEEMKKYERFEYYRFSSISKELHNRLLEKVGLDRDLKCTRDGKALCSCPNCVRRKKLEHCRWNAYTMSIGYVFGSPRSDRAKRHDKLVNWSELNEWDRAKD